MYKLLFIITALFVIMFSVTKCNEGFADTVASTPEVTSSIPITSDNVADYIYKIYKADVKAIQNLADIAMKLQAGGVTVPGNMMIQNTLSVTNDTTLSGKLNVSGASALGGALGVTGATTLSSTLGVTGDTNIGGNLNVTGGTTVKGNITTNSDITFIQNNNGQDNGSYVIFNNEPNTRGRGANINTRGLYMYAYGTSGNWGKGQTDHDFVISVQPTLVNIGNNLNIGGTLTVKGKNLADLLIKKIYYVKWLANTEVNQSYVVCTMIQEDRINSSFAQEDGSNIAGIDTSGSGREQGVILKKGAYKYTINSITNNSNDVPKYILEQRRLSNNESMATHTFGYAPRWGGNANPGHIYTNENAAWNQTQTALASMYGYIQIQDDARVFCYPGNQYYASGTNCSINFEWLWALN